ncbi:MAG: MoaD/ThiS family protein [Phycisphaerales bacterium]|nr:MoaD/ThiS family protein [Phycisphaerales bacterium]
MQIQVLVFGVLASTVGDRKVVVKVASPATAADVLSALAAQHPSLQFALPAARLAVNSAFASSGLAVTESDEIALIALVGGG